MTLTYTHTRMCAYFRMTIFVPDVRTYKFLQLSQIRPPHLNLYLLKDKKRYINF